MESTHEAPLPMSDRRQPLKVKFVYCKTAMISDLEALVLDLLTAKAPTYGLDLVHASAGRLKRGSV